MTDTNTPKTREGLVFELMEALAATPAHSGVNRGSGDGSKLGDWLSHDEVGSAIGSVLTALESHGLRIVPVEATEEMRNAGYQVEIAQQGTDAPAVYAATLAASPFAPEDGG